MTHIPSPDDKDQEIAALQREVAALRAALGDDVWRLRRLAELGVAQAKLNHDLRNLMSSALMIADRLQASPDPKVSRSGGRLVAAIDQATDLLAATLDFAAEAAPRLSPSRFALTGMIAELTSELCARHPDLTVENRASAALYIEADQAQLRRAFGHLLGTAAKAQAKRIVVEAEHQGSTVSVMLTDDGRPFREGITDAPLRPLSGAFRYGSTGLGFVIARDLIEAHGGTITIRSDSGPDRTCLVLSLPRTTAA